MGGHGGRGRDEVGLFRRGVAVAEVDFDVDAGGVAELGLWDPCEEEVGGGRGGFSRGRRGRAVVGGALLLEEGDVAGDVVFSRWCWVDVDLLIMTWLALSDR